VGGEFVMTEQRPRMQTRAMVLPLKKGDAAIFAVNSRPVRGVRGDYLRQGPRAVFLRSIPRARAPELVAALGTSYAPGARLSCDQDRNECDFAIFLWRGPVGLILHGVHSLAEGEYR
jgi:hypothetical protein